jgi:hypothetical protein
MSQVLVFALLMAALISELAAQTQWVAAGVSPRVGIFLDFEQSPSESSLQAMQREVAAVLSETGAEFSWHLLNAERALQTFDDLAVLRFGGSCRAGKFTAGEASLERVTLGSTEVASEGVTPYSRVECGQLQSSLAGMLATFCPTDRDGVFGRALGRVVAHELYHILGRTTEHTHGGVSKALQTPFDLVRQDFHLDPQALLWLRRRLQPAKKAAPGTVVLDAASD